MTLEELLALQKESKESGSGQITKSSGLSLAELESIPKITYFSDPLGNLGSGTQSTTPAFTEMENPLTAVPKTVGKYAVSTVQHPVTTAFGIEKGAMDFFFNVSSGIAGLLGEDGAKKYIEDNKQAWQEIFTSTFEKTESQKNASAVGQFVGSQVPYILGGEVLAAAGVASAIPLLAKYGGGLNISTVSNIGKLTRMAANAAGFIGLDQLTYTPEEGTRADAVKRDLITLGVLEGLGATFKGILNASAMNRIRSYLEEVKASRPPLSELEAKNASLFSEIKSDTGQEPQKLLQLAYREPKLLEAPKQGRKIAGEGFTMVDKAEKGAVAKSRAVQNYDKELSKYIQNPTPAQKEKVLKAKELRDTALAAETKPELPRVEKTRGVSVEPAEEVVQVPKSQLPVGTGETKTSALESRVKGVLDSAPEETKSSLSTYSAMNNKQQIADAVKYVQEHPDDALQILEGKKAPPKGLLTNSIYVAMTEDASTNSELAAKLASLRSTRYGQEIEILKSINKDNPVRYMDDLVQTRIEALGGRERMLELKTKEVKEIKKAVSQLRLAKEDWSAFVQSIAC
jgi:hypothetical protein